jgi:hypothetical protein
MSQHSAQLHERTPSRLAALAALVLLVCIVTGCGSKQLKTAVVRGNVTYQGKAVSKGTIMFMPASGPTASGELQADGSYALTTYQSGDGAVPGDYTVVIMSIGERSGLPEDRNPLAPALVPDRFTSVATSPLRAEVKDEENTIHFNLDDHRK